MEERDQYGAQNEIYDDGYALPEQNTGQLPLSDEASFYQPPEMEPDPAPIIVEQPVEIINNEPEPPPLPPDDPAPEFLPTEPDTGLANQIIDYLGNAEIALRPEVLPPDASVYKSIPNVPPDSEVVNPGLTIKIPLGVTGEEPEPPPLPPDDPAPEFLPTEPDTGLANQIIDPKNNIPILQAPAVLPPDASVYQKPLLTEPVEEVVNPGLAIKNPLGVSGEEPETPPIDTTVNNPIYQALIVPPPPDPSVVQPPVSVPPTQPLAQLTPSITTYNTFTDNPTRSQYVLLRDASGVERWYKDLGQFGLELQTNMPTPGATTDIPQEYQSGTVAPPGTVVINPNAMGPLQIPLVTQLKDPDASNYGQQVLAYDVYGTPHWYLSTPGIFGWVKDGNPVPAGTPNATIVSPTVEAPANPPVGVCAGFSIDADGIPAGLSYGTEPGEYVFYSGLTSQVSNYSQFGLITSTRWGNPPYDYYQILSISQISSTVNEQGITVCVFSVNYNRASRNPERPPSILPPTEDPPLAGVISITVTENSTLNPITLPVTGSVVQEVEYILVNRLGSVVTPAGTANILEYQYTPAPNYSGGDRITFRVRGQGGSSNYGRVDITVTPATPIGTPVPFNFLDLGYQPGNTVVEGTSVTITSSPTPFPGEWNMALFAEFVSVDPGGVIPPKYQDSLYVVGIKRTRGATTTTHNISATPLGTPNSLRVGVQHGDVITPIIRTPFANAGVQTVVDYRMRLSPPGFPDGPGGGYSVLEDTFQVRVQPADVNPDPFDFQNQGGLNISTQIDTNEVTVQGVTPGTPVPIRLTLRTGTAPSYTYVPYGNLRINDGSGYVTTGNTSVVYLGYTVRARIISPAIHTSTDTYRVIMGPAGYQQTDDFTITTRDPTVGPAPPWYQDQTGLNVSTASPTNPVVFATEVPGTLSVDNGATIVVNGVNTGLSSTIISGGQSISIQATSSSSFSTPRTFTVTLVVVSSTYVDTFVYTTRSQIVNPTYSGDFVNRTGRELSEVVTSNTLTLSAFDGPQPLILTNDNSDATAVIFLNGNNVGTTTNVNPGDTVAIRGTADNNEYYKTTNYTLTCGTTTRPWSITTKHNDHMILFDPY